MEMSPWEATSCPASHDFSNILWYRKVHYRVHKSQPLVFLLSQINPDHSISVTSTAILSSHLCLRLPSYSFPPYFPTGTLCAFFFSPMRNTYPAHHILLDLIILIISGDEYKLVRPSLCRFISPPIVSSFIRYFVQQNESVTIKEK
jgi:hypothetical protein